jgi:hypothetical protein
MAITTRTPHKKRYNRLSEPVLGVIRPIPKAIKKPITIETKAVIFHLVTLFFNTKALAKISPKKKAQSGMG